MSKKKKIIIIGSIIAVLIGGSAHVSYQWRMNNIKQKLTGFWKFDRELTKDYHENSTLKKEELEYQLNAKENVGSYWEFTENSELKYYGGDLPPDRLPIYEYQIIEIHGNHITLKLNIRAYFGKNKPSPILESFCVYVVFISQNQFAFSGTKNAWLVFKKDEKAE